MLFWVAVLGASAALAALAVWLRMRRAPAFVEREGLPWRPKKPSGRRVLIIGSGLSGTQALKTARAYGHAAVLLEARSTTGGLWRYRPEREEVTVYESTHIDTGRDLNSFGDVPVPAEWPLVLGWKHVTRYLEAQLDRFELRGSVRCGARVTRVRRESASGGPDGCATWRATWREGAVEHDEVFDAVLVCTGRHSTPYRPAFAGLDDFEGDVLHSAEYKNFESVRGERVVVVGAGNSGTDLATELSRAGKRVTLVARSGAWVTDMGGVPLNSLGDSAFFSQTNTRLPHQWIQKLVLHKAFLDTTKFGDQRMLNDAGLTPNHGWMEAHPTVTGLVGETTLHDEVRSGRLTVKKNLARVTARSVEFADGTEQPVDTVILATGFKQSVNFVDREIVDLSEDRDGNAVPLYLGMWTARRQDKTLAFINFVQSASFLCADLQTRLFFEALQGAWQLPSDAAMRAEITATHRTLLKRWRDSPRHQIQHGISALYYIDLAEKIGCRPTFQRVLLERPSALRHVFSPVTALSYRLVGPGATADAEREIDARLVDLKRGGLRGRLQKRPPGFFGTLLTLNAMLLAARLAGHHVSRKIYRQDYCDEELRKEISHDKVQALAH